MGLHDLCQTCRQLMNAQLSKGAVRIGLVNQDEHPVSYYFLLADGSVQDANSFQISTLQDRLRSQGLEINDTFGRLFRHADYQHNVLIHHRWIDLCLSAENGCHLCSIVKFASISASGSVTNTLSYHKSRSWVIIPTLEQEGAWDLEEEPNPELVRLRLRMTLVREEGSEECLLLPPIAIRAGMRVKDIKNQSPAWPGASVRLSTVEAIREWVKRCSSGQHRPWCSDAISQPFSDPKNRPRRLIHIRSEHGEVKARLFDTQTAVQGDMATGYATLSHCWGSAEIICRLQRGNYEKYLRDIALGDLPATFREAILFTSALQVEFLWIDAMCIMQDSPDDWATEAPRMAPVYSNGLFNISATASRGPSEGLFVQDYLKTPCVSSVTWTADDFVTRLSFGVTSPERSIRETPLQQRAWAFQEHVLSPRILHFAQDQIWWECSKETVAELHDCDLHARYDFRGSLGNWAQIVQDYAKRHLTKPSDRLMAITGCAQAHANHDPNLAENDWLAGLWATMLPADLLWTATAGAEAQRRYIAPSWSWASVDGPVTMRMQTHKPTADIYFRVQSASTRSASLNPFSAVVSGELKVAANLLPFRLWLRPTGEASIKFKNGPQVAGERMLDASCDIPHDPYKDDWFSIWLDPGQHEYRNNPLVGSFCPMEYENIDEGILVWGLVLSCRSEAERIYRRIGVLRVWVPDQSIHENTATTVLRSIRPGGPAWSDPEEYRIV